METEVLVVVDSICNGGIERVVYNLATTINRRRIRMHIYVLDDSQMHYKVPLENIGVVVVNEYSSLRRQSRRNKRLLLFSCIHRYLSVHRTIYAVHVHSANQAPEVLLAALACHIPVRCMHAHIAYSDFWNPRLFPWKSRLLSFIFRWSYNLLSTHRIGCSKAACASLYGSRASHTVIYNGIDLGVFSPQAYANKRKLQHKYGFREDESNFIFVGRFAPQKNILYMLRAFSHLLHLRPECMLSLVGHGEQEHEIRDTITSLGMEQNTRFFPHNSCIPELLKASDYFISPSLYEGLGIVFVEAQLMGIPAFASDQIPEEADIGLFHRVPLAEGEEAYAQYIHCYIKSEGPHKPKANPDKVNRYDMRAVARLYETIYTGQA